MSNDSNGNTSSNPVSTSDIAKSVMEGMGVATTDNLNDIAAEKAGREARSARMSAEVDDVVDNFDPDSTLSGNLTSAIAQNELRKAANVEARQMALDAMPNHLRGDAEKVLERLTEADIREVLADYASRTDVSWQERRKEALRWATRGK